MPCRSQSVWWCSLLAVPLLIACGPRTVPENETDGSSGTSTKTGTTTTGETDPSSSGPGTTTGTTGPSKAEVVDILFVIDNSGSMGPWQAFLASGIGPLVNTLEALGADYRVGVTTTDNGNPWCSGTTPEGGNLRATSCRGRLDEFVFAGTDPPTDAQNEACLTVCAHDDLALLPTATENDPAPKVRPWFEAANLPADVTMQEALACGLPQGINGCGFESPLESMYKALRRSEEPNEAAAGFVRSNSVLAVIVVSDELDCSAQNNFQDIFLPEGNKVFWSDPNSPFPTSAVCWNAGVSCTGGPGVYDDCFSEDYDIDGAPATIADLAVLHSLGRYESILADLPQPVLFAGVLGVPVTYPDGGPIVYQDTADPSFQSNFGIGPGCSSVAGDAVPPVRMRELEERITGERLVHSICALDYGPAMQQIAGAIVVRLGG